MHFKLPTRSVNAELRRNVQNWLSEPLMASFSVLLSSSDNGLPLFLVSEFLCSLFYLSFSCFFIKPVFITLNHLNNVKLCILCQNANWYRNHFYLCISSILQSYLLHKRGFIILFNELILTWAVLGKALILQEFLDGKFSSTEYKLKFKVFWVQFKKMFNSSLYIFIKVTNKKVLSNLFY